MELASYETVRGRKIGEDSLAAVGGEILEDMSAPGSVLVDLDYAKLLLGMRK